MPPKLPALTGKQVIRALEKGGWSVKNVVGSYHHLTHPEKPGKVSVPVHGNEDIGLKLLNLILKQAGLNREEFRGLL